MTEVEAVQQKRKQRNSGFSFICCFASAQPVYSRAPALRFSFGQKSSARGRA
jgi:hypothetical protein